MLRRISLTIFALFAAFAITVVGQNAGDTSDPTTLQPTGFVNDYVGVIDPATKAELEKKLTDLKATTDPQVEIAVAVIKTTGGRDIFDYSIMLARTWKIGTKADDNPSALLVVAIDDRKYFTQISRDLEDELPDGLVGSLQRRYLVPEFKVGNYSKGINDTIDAYIARIRDKGNVAGRPEASPAAGSRDDSMPAEGYCAIACVVGLLLLILFVGYLLSRFTGGGRGRRGGGGGGGSDLLESAAPWVIGGIINTIVDSASSGSSDWGSSDWGSSGGSDGGWGGFGGGGDFGGGGAGGDW